MHVACEAREIRFEGRHVHARTALHERMSAPAQEWYESVTGPLQRWSASRGSSPRRSSKLQQMKKQATVAAAVRARKVLKYLKKTASPMRIMCWQWGDLVIGSLCDPSHADEHCERTGEPSRSQRGRMTLLATRGLVDQTECGFHVIACASNTLKTVCFFPRSQQRRTR